jgi:hypothetical protein
MRILMSILRILLGLLIALSVIAAWIAGMAYLPGVFARIVASIPCWLIGAYFFYTSYSALRKGRIGINAGAKIVVYERSSFEFWFYVFLFGFAGVLVFWGIYWIITTDQLHPR